MRSKKDIEQEEVSEGAPEWMTTYSDMVTLLLTFFVLLFQWLPLISRNLSRLPFR